MRKGSTLQVPDPSPSNAAPPRTSSDAFFLEEDNLTIDEKDQRKSRQVPDIEKKTTIKDQSTELLFDAHRKV